MAEALAQVYVMQVYVIVSAGETLPSGRIAFGMPIGGNGAILAK
jgi:hypothetical protein